MGDASPFNTLAKEQARRDANKAEHPKADTLDELIKKVIEKVPRYQGKTEFDLYVDTYGDVGQAQDEYEYSLANSLDNDAVRAYCVEQLKRDVSELVPRSKADLEFSSTQIGRMLGRIPD